MPIQHGPGLKHERDIVVERWRAEIVARGPWSSFGASSDRMVRSPTEQGEYAYLSYEFSNRSSQIRQLFMDACDRVDVEYREYQR